jgi:hypothetical protein
MEYRYAQGSAWKIQISSIRDIPEVRVRFREVILATALPPPGSRRRKVRG